MTRADLVARAVANDVMAAPVNGIADVVRDPQVLHNRMIVPIEHPALGRVNLTGVPLRLSATPGTVQKPPPTLGQHSAEVLSELGYTAEEVVRLRAAGVTV
jgi:CoA:oxalate CoA-transferase